MMKYLRPFLYVALSIILVGCANPKNDTTQKYQQCRAVYSNKSGKEICRSYWNNSDYACDDAMRSLMGTAINSDACRAERTASNQNPSQSYNQSRNAVNAYCQSKYSRTNTPSICQSYWSNSDQQCDQAMREIVESRGITVSGNSCYGVYVPQQRQTTSTANNASPKENIDNSAISRICRRDYISTPTNILCQSYWLNSDQKCDSAIREIITERGVNITSNSCFVDRNRYSASSTNPTTIDSSAQNRLVIPNASSARCESFIRGIVSASNPIETACKFRYNSLQEETILCRKELNSIINDNSKGVGTSSSTCGIKQ